MSLHHHPPEAWTGAGLAFIAFVLTAALPALVYGGYMGLVMGGALFGRPIEPTWLLRVMTGGGMLLGFVATLSLFLVVGATVGTGVGAAVRKVTGAGAHPDLHPKA